MFFITFKNRSRFKREITSIKFIKLLISYALSITIDPNLRWPKRRGFHQKKQKNHKTYLRIILTQMLWLLFGPSWVTRGDVMLVNDGTRDPNLDKIVTCTASIAPCQSVSLESMSTNFVIII